MLFWHKVVGVGIFVSFIGCVILVHSLLIVPSSIPNEDKPTNDWFGSSESFIVPAGEHITREREFPKGTMLTISYVIGDGYKGIKLLVVNESDYWRWRDGQPVQSPFPMGGSGAVSGNITFTIPNDANWFFIWDNSFDLTDEKEVTAKVTYYY